MARSRLVHLLAAGATASAVACASPPPRTGVLVPDGSPSFVIMDFSAPFPIDPLPDGWYHRRFRTADPMDVSFATKAGRHALRLATHGSASMLFRHVEVDLATYPILAWSWFIAQGIRSDADERTSAGDDHPARLLLAFESATSGRHRTEIIWGNRRLGAGDYLYLRFGPAFLFDAFPHYVANGRASNEGRWHDERVDLTTLYRHMWDADPQDARLVDVALFCDSDQTGDPTEAYFADVRVERTSGT